MKYYSLKPILKENSDFNFIIGQRANGKSYSVKDYILKDYAKNNKKFVLIKRFSTDIKKQAVERYFSDMDISKYIPDSQFITMRAGVIYTAIRTNDNKVKLQNEIGFCLPLATQVKFKSQAFNDIGTCVFEEFNANEYLTDEVEEFFNLYSTVNRAKNNVKVFFIGNAVIKFNPYVIAFNLIEKTRNMKPGDILTEKINNFTVSIEYCKIIKSIREKTPDFLDKNLNEGDYNYGGNYLKGGVYKKSKLILEYMRKCGDFILIEQILTYNDLVYFFVYPYTGKKRKKLINEDSYTYNTHISNIRKNKFFEKVYNMRLDEIIYFATGDTEAIYKLYKGGTI